MPAGLREELYRAYVSRASSAELDNGPIIDKILGLRKEKAALLGFPHFADLSMASKMAELHKVRGRRCLCLLMTVML